jgi:hypothetical protein
VGKRKERIEYTIYNGRTPANNSRHQPTPEEY